jgi:hypothetical protein
LFLLPVSRNFSNPRVLPTNRAVAPLAGRPKKHNQVLVGDAAVSKVENAKCMMRFAPPAVKALPFHFNLAVTNRFIAAIVSNPEDLTEIKNTKPPAKAVFLLKINLFSVSLCLSRKYF